MVLLTHAKWCALLLAAASALVHAQDRQSAERERHQWQEYQAVRPKTVVELQPFRRESTLQWRRQNGQSGLAELIDLQPTVNAWYLLGIQESSSEAMSWYHLENAQPDRQRIVLDAAYPQGLRIDLDGQRLECLLWNDANDSPLVRARRSGLPYAPLCNGRIYLRNRVAGTYTNLERVTQFLRDHVWQGEQIVGFVRNEMFRDAFIEHGVPAATAADAAASASAFGHPAAAMLASEHADRAIEAQHLGIEVVNASAGMILGRWYAVRGGTGIFVSAIEPRAIDAAILAGSPKSGAKLDAVEAQALDYLVAFDLSEFALGFSIGTDHPRVGWSMRAPAQVRDERLSGPDGIDTIAPLVANGMVNPAVLHHVAATFTGGFKREHGAFRTGDLSRQNFGSHYGFIEQGVVLSKLVPGLATIYATSAGTVDMGTWKVEDEARLRDIVFARQNGVPLIEFDAVTRRSYPGALVSNWGAGNWSGSSDERLRTLRAGVCLQQSDTGRFLLYGYFSSATPMAMARVFQAYGCRYAMHLDMNALEHTYLAVYVRDAEQIAVEHLIDGMAVVDRKGGNALAPRFLGFPDDRDFFYLTRKGGRQ